MKDTVNTRDLLLDSAERLFAARGVDSVSLREITAAAEANLASVNYHFGSKENLVREVFARRLGPLNEERLRLLDEAERGRRRPRLEDVIFAFVHPVVNLLSVQPDAGSDFVRLMGHVHADTNHALADLVIGEMREMIARFISAISRALPNPEPRDILWKAHFATGAMVHTASSMTLLSKFSNGVCSGDEPPGEISRRLVSFIVGGFKADARKTVIPIDRAVKVRKKAS